MLTPDSQKDLPSDDLDEASKRLNAQSRRREVEAFDPVRELVDVKILLSMYIERNTGTMLPAVLSKVEAVLAHLKK